MARLETFTAWFKDHGGTLHSDVEFAWSHRNGFHLRMKHGAQAKSTLIVKNTTIVSCPHSLSLSALNALPSPPLQPGVIGDDESKRQKRSERLVLPQELLGNARPQCIAAFWLCTQYLLQNRSPWYGYIAILPRPPPCGQDGAVDELSEEGVDGMPIIDTAVWWTEDERLAIAGTNLARGIEDLESVWKKEWKTWSPLLLDWAAEKDLAGLDWRLFKWAVSIYGSRAFSSAVLSFVTDSQSGKRLLEIVDPHALLYPGVDMLNHSNETKNGWLCNEKGFALVCNDEPRPGEEIFNSYGMKDNGSLLLSFGFALADNPRDAFALKLPRTKSPALLEALKASKSRPEDEDRSAASALRFASSIDARKGPDVPISPGQTILINETETPLSHDPDHNIFYVRLAKNLAMLSILHNRRPNPGYPQFPVGPPYDDHLCGFSSTLIENLAAHLANERETKQATTALSKGSNEKLWRLLGERNQMALTILLFERLRMEAVRLLSLGLVTEKTVDLPRTDLGTTATTSDRRYQQAVTYVQDQLEIVLDNVLRLRWKILTSLAGLEVGNDLASQIADTISPHWRNNVEVPTATFADKLEPRQRQEEVYLQSLLRELTDQKPIATQLFTIDRALSIMMKLEPNFAHEFMVGILTLTGRDPHLVAGEHQFHRGIEQLRRSSSTATEEDVFVLWIIAMYVLRYRLEDSVSWHIYASPLFAGICELWRRSYGLKAFMLEKIEERSDNDEGDSGDKPVLLRDGAVVFDLAAIRLAVPESDLWSSKVWDHAEDFVAVAQRIVKEESVSVILSEDEYAVLNETVDALDKIALADAYPQVDVETEDVVRVVALYLPAAK